MKNCSLYFLLLIIFNNPLFTKAQQSVYANPIIHADYSDPDVIQVGDDYYMVSSSFNCVPGLPILHSKDLVHWEIIAHALNESTPTDVFSKPQHGAGVWAPAIRYHNNEFYIFYPDPDNGIFLIKSKSITGKWSKPITVEYGKGLIDPCPFWDDDGKLYLVHAFAGSRAGIKSVLVIREVDTTTYKANNDRVLVYDGHDIDPTIEGPKLYKRNNYYYIFAPAGGVSTGWQTVLRSKNIYGPYERRVVMHQGKTTINGPHQGAWVHTNFNEDWFIHFQDKDAYGRVVHLQPMIWKNDWPIIGSDNDNYGIGEPVVTYKLPKTKFPNSKLSIKDNDEFNDIKLGLQWQWHGNPSPNFNWSFCFPSKGVLRLNSVPVADALSNLWQVPNLLLQKLPAENFTATVKTSFNPKTTGEQFGFVMMGINYAHLSLIKKDSGIALNYNTCVDADKFTKEKVTILSDNIEVKSIYFKITVKQDAVVQFAYSVDGISFTNVNDTFTAKQGKWIGAKLGFFCNRTTKTNDAGFADIDWIRIEK